MNLSRNELYRIILEEYLISEGYWDHAGDDAAEELLKKIMGDKYRSPEDRGHTRHITKGGDTAPMENPHSGEDTEELTGVVDTGETMTVDDVQSPQMSADELASTIGELVHGRDPEEVSEIFQMVFGKLPGVELSSPGDEDYPEEETLYSPGAEGRPVAGFQLEGLMELIREVLGEGHYHDMGAEDEMYDALDPHGFDKMSDYELIDAMHVDGMEDMVVTDGEGGLANREEVIAALKNV